MLPTWQGAKELLQDSGEAFAPACRFQLEPDTNTPAEKTEHMSPTAKPQNSKAT
jgi:hypothetical protein